MRNSNDQIGAGIDRGRKEDWEEAKEWKGSEKDGGGGKVKGMLSTWHSVGPSGNDQEARVRD